MADIFQPTGDTLLGQSYFLLHGGRYKMSIYLFHQNIVLILCIGKQWLLFYLVADSE